MLYYIFKVSDSTGREYYIVNNRWISYINYDSNRTRSLAEYNNGITQKYQLFAKGEATSDRELHGICCASERMTEERANELAETSKLKLSRDKVWYEIYYPDKNSSEHWLKEIGGTKEIR